VADLVLVALLLQATVAQVADALVTQVTTPQAEQVLLGKVITAVQVTQPAEIVPPHQVLVVAQVQLVAGIQRKVQLTAV
jgi:hypothetical protein